MGERKGREGWRERSKGKGRDVGVHVIIGGVQGVKRGVQVVQLWSGTEYRHRGMEGVKVGLQSVAMKGHRVQTRRSRGCRHGGIQGVVMKSTCPRRVTGYRHGVQGINMEV